MNCNLSHERSKQNSLGKSDSRDVFSIKEGFSEEVTGELQPKKEKYPVMGRAGGGACQECAKTLPILDQKNLDSFRNYNTM